MVEVVGVRFKPAGRIYYYTGATNQITYTYNQEVLVESQKAKELAFVAIPKKEIPKEDLPDELKPILQVATEKELRNTNKTKLTQKKPILLLKIKFQNINLK